MQKLLLTIDKISTWIGQFFSWLIVALTLMISWEVFSRYVLDAPHPWAFDVMSMMYGSLFMMAGAYTLSKNGQVRGDVLYGFFPPRLQAWLDLVLYILFFIPGVVALAYAGYGFAAIIVAFVGRLHPVGMVFSAILMSMFYIGGELAQSRLGLPKSITGVFQGLLLFCLLACDTLVAYRLRWINKSGSV